MTRKTLIALLFVFILSGCGSSAETIPISTLTPTLPATSTPQPTATLTLTPSPTVTPIPYTSGVDDELQAKILAEAEQAMGMTVQEKFAEWEHKGFLFLNVSLKENGSYSADQLYLGTEMIDMGYIPGFLDSDRALIAFGYEKWYVEPIPYVVGYEYQGNFYQTNAMWLLHPDYSSNPDPRLNMVDSLEGLKQSWDELQIGDVIRFQLQTFGQIPDKTLEEWQESALPENFERGTLGWATDSILQLIRLMDNNFIERMQGISSGDVLKLLAPSKGDIGLFAIGTVINLTK